MKTEKVIAAVESTIMRVTRDIKKKQGTSGVDKLDSLSKLVNSYSRLLERNQELSGSEDAGNGYYEAMENGFVRPLRQSK